MTAKVHQRPETEHETEAESENGLTPSLFEAANVNPVTRLATDYLNHFNEIEMLVGMLAEMPDCLDDVMAWSPRSYIDHFEQSNFNGREVVVAAYKTAEPSVRSSFEVIVAELNHHIEQGQRALLDSKSDPIAFGQTIKSVMHELRPLMTQARGIVNGEVTCDESLQAEASDKVAALFS